MGQGLAAIAENVKKRKEAEEAASGKPVTPAPPVAGLAAAKPKPKPTPPPTKKTTSQLTSDVDRIMAGYEDTTGVPAKK